MLLEAMYACLLDITVHRSLHFGRFIFFGGNLETFLPLIRQTTELFAFLLNSFIFHCFRFELRGEFQWKQAFLPKIVCILIEQSLWHFVCTPSIFCLNARWALSDCGESRVTLHFMRLRTKLHTNNHTYTCGPWFHVPKLYIVSNDFVCCHKIFGQCIWAWSRYTIYIFTFGPRILHPFKQTAIWLGDTVIRRWIIYELSRYMRPILKYQKNQAIHHGWSEMYESLSECGWSRLRHSDRKSNYYA